LNNIHVFSRRSGKAKKDRLERSYLLGTASHDMSFSAMNGPPGPMNGRFAP
jgi:hypothetical protein